MQVSQEETCLQRLESMLNRHGVSSARILARVYAESDVRITSSSLIACCSVFRARARTLFSPSNEFRRCDECAAVPCGAAGGSTAWVLASTCS
jgi:broad specificity phosphatase PhoE